MQVSVGYEGDLKTACPQCGNTWYSTGYHGAENFMQCPKCGAEYLVVIVKTELDLNFVDSYLADSAETIQMWSKEKTIYEYLEFELDELYTEIWEYLKGYCRDTWDEFPRGVREEILKDIKSALKDRYDISVEDYYAG